MGWLVDPETREPLPARPAVTDEMRRRAYEASHWGDGWRSGVEREDGIPVRMWFAPCQDECCAESRARWKVTWARLQAENEAKGRLARRATVTSQPNPTTR